MRRRLLPRGGRTRSFSPRCWRRTNGPLERSPPGGDPEFRRSGGTGCRIEDRTPTGTRRDEDTIHQLLGRMPAGCPSATGRRSGRFSGRMESMPDRSGPARPTDYHQAVSIDAAVRILERWLRGVERENFDVRVLRTDFRQQGDLAPRSGSSPGGALPRVHGDRAGVDRARSASADR